MSETKTTHTPGPWTIGYHAINVMAKDEKGAFPICDIRGWGHFVGKGHGALALSQEDAIAIQTANARLIAAAPDLLVALQLVLDEYFDGYGLRCIDEVRAAIAKVNGV